MADDGEITIGPHLLGRKQSPPDERDTEHLAEDRLEDLRLGVPEPDDALLDLTIREALAQGFFSTWASVRAFWRWVKQGRKPTPTPTPEPPPEPAKRRQRWNVAYLLNQGNTGHCTAYAAAHWGIADPVNSSWTKPQAETFYYREKEVDGEPGAEDGSTIRTVGKVLREQGRIAEYVWISRVDEEGDRQVETLVDWLLNQGPVILGIDWYDDMFEPNAKGVIRPTGSYAGGHAPIACGVDLDTQLVEIANSWGTDWGIGGHAFISLSDMQKLLDARGEALAGLELPLAA